MFDGTEESEKRRVFLMMVYMWTSIYLLAGSALGLWVADIPQVLEWVRENKAFLLISGIGCGAACLWLYRYLTPNCLKICTLLFTVSAVFLINMDNKRETVDGIFMGILCAGVFFGLIAVHGYLTKLAMEGNTFIVLGVLVATGVLVGFHFFSPVSFDVEMNMSFTFVCYAIGGLVSHAARMRWYMCKGAEDISIKNEMRSCMTCLVFPLFIMVVLLLYIVGFRKIFGKSDD